MITFSIKDINGVADCVCTAGNRLIFARYACRNQEELRGLRYAYQKEKWITIAGEHFQLKKEALLWSSHQVVKSKGLGLWSLTAYLPQSGDQLYFIHDKAKPVAGDFAAFLYQHTPYPVPSLQDELVLDVLRACGEQIPVEAGDSKIAAFYFTAEAITEILERLV